MVRRDWWIPASLLALTLVPVAAGVFRVAELAAGQANETDQRFFDAPVPVVVHVFGATIYCVLGAFQFMPSFRRRRPRWHRWSGRVLVPAGLAGALSGLWMSVSYDLPAHDNTALMWLRLFFGSLMAAGLVLGLLAIRRRDVHTHQRWMARAYAVAQGAGTQALILGPMVLFVEQPGGTLKAIGMGAAWAINLAVAEWLVRRSRRPLGLSDPTPRLSGPGGGDEEEQHEPDDRVAAVRPAGERVGDEQADTTMSVDETTANTAAISSGRVRRTNRVGCQTRNAASGSHRRSRSVRSMVTSTTAITPTSPTKSRSVARVAGSAGSRRRVGSLSL